MATQIETAFLKYHYHLVDFRDLDAAVLLASPLPAERMLAILGRTPDMRNTIREVRQLERREPKRTSQPAEGPHDNIGVKEAAAGHQRVGRENGIRHR